MKIKLYAFAIVTMMVTIIGCAPLTDEETAEDKLVGTWLVDDFILGVGGTADYTIILNSDRSGSQSTDYSDGSARIYVEFKWSATETIITASNSEGSQEYAYTLSGDILTTQGKEYHKQ